MKYVYNVNLMAHILWGFPGGRVVKNLPANAADGGDAGSSLGQEDPLEKEMATHSSILTRIIYAQRSLAGYGPRGHKEADTTEPARIL